jgi:hypothetical protein
MESINLALEILVGYVLIVWILLPLVVPNLGVRRKVPGELPEYWREVLNGLQATVGSDKEFLMGVYNAVTTRHHGGRMETVTKCWKAFQDPLLQEPGFMHCTGLNFLVRALLIRSGRFSAQDIRVVTVPFNFFIHQYLRVRADGVWYDIDPWALHTGTPFGKKKSWFG